MNFQKLAIRIAEQSITALPVEHDVALPLFEDESQEATLEKLSESAQVLVDGVTAYLESIGEDMENSGHIVPGEMESVNNLRRQHVEAICQKLIEQAMGEQEKDSDESFDDGPLEELTDNIE